ncbi:LysR family transcriptional regulator [Marinomonas sp. A3A]|jgi:DNA-binding transcriptional LysR family regulator|uniref:LysR family transcriptional regulator n=1 Tax=Marinomonas sp. A3A TaxID=2065312 RepID=UPI001BB39501|nr:LysR family transcriptional regulator [Marinomonas sp. A3A]QUX91390.1 LysR family transcriptional regulator [Marinomonas sp. A3A]
MDINKLIALLPDMAAFVAVVETGSFTKAALKLGVTPSGVSRQVSRMETTLSSVLIERTTRRQTTTLIGMAVYEQCRQMLDSAKEAVAASENNAKEAAGRLRIAAPDAFAKQVLEPLLLEFMALYPAISLQVQVTDLRIDPAYQNVDLVFYVAEKPHEHLVCKTLGKVRSILCASPDYVVKNGIPNAPEDLLNHLCLPLGFFDGDNIWTFTQGERKSVVTVDGRYINNDADMRLRGVRQGFGIAPFPDFVVREYLEKGDVVQVLSDWHLNSDFQGGIHMQFPAMRFMPNKIRVFIDFMMAHFGKK